MADVTFNMPAGQTGSRELLVAFLNVGTSSSPEWAPFGKRVEDSDLEYDWNVETIRDIFGNTFSSMKKPVITQSFDPWALSGGEKAQQKLYDLGYMQHDINALTNQDCLIIHQAIGSATAGFFAERYPSCTIEPSRLGGEGGGNLTMGCTVTYGGERVIGTAKPGTSGPVFTPET